MGLEFLPDSASYTTWLFGQSAVVVVQMLWIGSLILSNRRERKAREASDQRNDELSERLVDVLLESSRERSERRESLAKSVIETIEKTFGER